MSHSSLHSVHKTEEELKIKYQELRECLSLKRFKKKLFNEICSEIDRLEAVLRIAEKQR